MRLRELALMFKCLSKSISGSSFMSFYATSVCDTIAIENVMLTARW